MEIRSCGMGTREDALDEEWLETAVPSAWFIWRTRMAREWLCLHSRVVNFGYCVYELE